jgi:hypothetical protein
MGWRKLGIDCGSELDHHQSRDHGLVMDDGSGQL